MATTPAQLLDRAGGRPARIPAQDAGGRRQRIALARNILKDASIPLPGKATPARRGGTRATIRHKLSGMMEGQTVIAIAHRPATIARMDGGIPGCRRRPARDGTPPDLPASAGAAA